MIKNSLELLDIKNIVDSFCKNNFTNIIFSLDMPKGYKTSFGTFDKVVNTLYFNFNIMKDFPAFKVLFYLYHELRHVLQYKKPNEFNSMITKSLNYVIMYNGVCYKLINNKWYKAKIDGSKDYLMSAYLGQPYELDANNFAYTCVKNIYGDLPELKQLYSLSLPKTKLCSKDYNKIYAFIDSQIKN